MKHTIIIFFAALFGLGVWWPNTRTESAPPADGNDPGLKQDVSKPQDQAEALRRLADRVESLDEEMRRLRSRIDDIESRASAPMAGSTSTSGEGDASSASLETASLSSVELPLPSRAVHLVDRLEADGVAPGLASRLKEATATWRARADEAGVPPEMLDRWSEILARHEFRVVMRTHQPDLEPETPLEAVFHDTVKAVRNLVGETPARYLERFDVRFTGSKP